MSIFETTALSVAGITAETATGAAAATRANIMEMTQAAEEAVLAPEDTGAFPHELRAALAARVARLNGDDALAERYLARAGTFAGLADTGTDGSAEGLAAVVGFFDKVAARTADVAAEDIAALQAAGVSDADIVRLCELNAFLAYQIRLIAGLRLMQGDAA